MSDPVKAASVGIGWWSDVVADAVQKTDAIEIVTCFTRNPEKRANFAKKYGCRESDQPTGWSDGRREAPQNRSGTLPPPRPPLGVGDLSDRGDTRKIDPRISERKHAYLRRRHREGSPWDRGAEPFSRPRDKKVQSKPLELPYEPGSGRRGSGMAQRHRHILPGLPNA